MLWIGIVGVFRYGMVNQNVSYKGGSHGGFLGVNPMT